MPDYQVGNLQIVFEAVDQTASAFDKLSKNLSAIKNVVFNISKIDSTSIKKFGENLEQIRVQFTPFLADIKNVGEELISLNNILKTAGGKPEKMTETANAIADISKNLSTTTQTNEELKETIIEGTNAIIAGANRAKKNTQDLVIQQQKAAIEAKQHELALLKANYAMGNLNITSKEYAQQVDNLESEIKRLSGAVDEVDKPVKKTTNSWKKFLNQIKRVAIYRLIRTLLKSVVSTFRDTINAFAQVDDGVNETMSSLTSSLNVIKLSIGTSILPLLQMIEPIVSQIAVAFANLGNMISATFAKEGKFTKINTEYIEDYRKQIEKTQGSLLDFDKFRVLNRQEGQLSNFLLPNQSVEEYKKELGTTAWQYDLISGTIQSISKFLATAFDTVKQIIEAVRPFASIVLGIASSVLNIATGLLDVLNKSGLIKPIVGAILGYLVAISATKIITWLGSGKLVTFISNVISKLELTEKNLSKILTSNKLLSISIGALAGSVFYFISSLDNMSKSTAWLVGGLSTLIGVLVGVATAIIAVKAAGLGLGAALKAAVSVGALTTAIGLAIGTAVSTANSSAKNNSAVSDRSTASIASATSSSISYGGYSAQTTSINTNTSTEQAMYNALVRYNRENPNDNTPIVVEIDGQKVFEATRRTAGRRGLGFGNI